MTQKITIGGFNEDVDDVRTLAWEYMNQYGTWSYPAYDSYPGNGDPLSIGPQDTLALGLIGAGQGTLAAQYTFLRLFDEINELLRDEALTGSLEDADKATLDAVARLYGVLDGKKTPQVRLIKLATVLHLKRPELFPLYDDNIWRCYGELGNIRVPRERGRNDAGFMKAWLPKIQKDLQNGLQHWKDMASMAPEGGPAVTPLRVLDMVAWRLVKNAGPRPPKRPKRE
jgi:hypothetical protein